ncbi:MAG: bile acid:sodium symporter family protein [Pseudomonadota bacterium]
MNVTALFPLWALLGTMAALLQPHWFAQLKPAIAPLLGLVMFGMGITLSGHRFVTVMQRPPVVVLGVLLQFLLMPLTGWVLALSLGMPPQLLVGVVLVGCSPGGTASNVICYLANGDVALSITLTVLTTLLAVLATPLLTLLYAGQRVPVPVFEMLLSILQIIIVPVVLGVLCNHVLRRQLALLKHLFRTVSVLAIVLIIAIIIALNHAQLAQLNGGVVAAVVLHNAVGLLGGYWLPRWLGRDERECRTLAIEVGMQNSGLAVALAVKYFSAAAALPGALFSVWHNLSGSLLAAWWGRRSP